MNNGKAVSHTGIITEGLYMAEENLGMKWFTAVCNLCLMGRFLMTISAD